MKKNCLKYFIFSFAMYIIFPVLASALTCTYEAPADSKFSEPAKIVCNLTESKKKCTITIGNKTNKENIINWKNAKKTGFVTQDYIKYNNQCPTGLIFNQAANYKLYAIGNVSEADNIIDTLKLKKARVATPNSNNNQITNCQYTFKSNDNQFLYLKYSYSDKLEWTDKFYWYASNTEKNINVYTNATKISNDATIGNSSKGFAGYKISHLTLDQMNFLGAFTDGKCEPITLIYYPDGSVKSLFVASGAYANTQPDDDGATYVKLIADKVTSDGEVIDDKTFEYSFDTLSTYLILGTKSDSSRYMRVKNSYLNDECTAYITDTRNDVACKIGDIQYIISKSEVEHLWSEKDNNLTYYEFEINQIHFSAQSRTELVSELSSNQVIVTDPTGTATSRMKLSKICKKNNTKKVMRFIGYLLIMVKILIPILLIYSGIVLFTKTVLDGNYDGLKKNATVLLKKVIIALVIFLVPTLVNFIFTLTEGSEEANSTFKGCRVCIFEPNKCKLD